ncbi:Gfo/Idh/MocA family oxidoreductase [Kitasatospora sp. GAS204B]|uniref:Gfo/Idh/MocA family protein n=1 Tax=unclassified Kitasatospora TaxID=2633591 RepID=UPI002474A719|nr:Gfo/Idh/MocA family oxidoreductase [Kitasatospora sp. GAS204B]MDH6118591.1 UDP-N-acetyl-2-amino-2-deoxyglucuronate dehydrogenase [Kitasatospora sp. GAS204B]
MAIPRSHAIVGCGRVAPNHVDGFRSLPDWTVAWACDRDQPTATAFAAEHGIPRWSAAWHELLDDPALTSASITVDHRQHAELAIAFLEAGKHVLVEKPMATQPADAQRMVDCAAANGRVLSVVAQHRYDPLVSAVRGWVREGLLGDLLYVAVSLQSSRPESYYADSYWRGTLDGEGGSALINQGYHCLDTVRWICGDLAVRAAVTSTKVLADVIETEETLSALLTADGVPVTMNVTVASSVDWRTRLEVVGALGSVTFDLDHPGTLHHWSGSAELYRRVSAEQARTAVAEPPGIDYYGISHRRQIADFCQSVTSGRPMLSTARDAIGTLDAVLGLYEHAAASAAAVR